MPSRLLASYEALARTYAKKMGVQLICRGSGFATNGKTIIIPDIPDELNKQLRDPSLAGIVHEGLHCEHSEFCEEEGKKGCCGNCRSCSKRNIPELKLGKFSGLLNNIEDIRMYELGKKEYPGMPSLQETGLNFIRDNLIIPKIAETKGTPEEKESMPVMVGGCLQYRASGIDDSFFPESIRKIADIAEKEVKNIKWRPREEGHEQSLEVTNKIIELIKVKLEEEQEKHSEGGNPEGEDCKEGTGEQGEQGEQEKENEDENDEDKDGEDEDEEEETKEEEEKEDGNNEKEEKKNEGGKPKREERNKEETTNEDNMGEGEEEGESKQGEGEENSLEQNLEDFLDEGICNSEENEDLGLQEMLEKIIGEIISRYNVNNNKHQPHPEIIKYDREEHIKNPYKSKNMPLSQIEEYERKFLNIAGNVDKQSRILKSKILPLLIAEKRASFMFEQESGTLDEARIFKIANGEKKVYKQRVSGKKTNTAISILCDVSGSMSYDKIDMLRPTLLVIGDTLFALKIPFEVLSFSTYHPERRDKNYEEIRRIMEDASRIRIYNRSLPLWHTIIKEFNENYLNSRKLVQFMEARCDNIDGESVEWAAKRLIERREQRKILFVLSDGYPASTTSSSRLLVKDLKEKVKAIEKAGIEIIGVGIIDDAPKKLYPTSVIIEDIDNISSSIYKALLQKLRN